LAAFNTILFGTGPLQLGLVLDRLHPDQQTPPVVLVGPDRPGDKDMHAKLRNGIEIAPISGTPKSWTGLDPLEITTPDAWVDVVADSATELLSVSIPETAQTEYSDALCAAIDQRNADAPPLLVLLAVNGLSDTLHDGLTGIDAAKCEVIPAAVDRMCPKPVPDLDHVLIRPESFAGEVKIRAPFTESAASAFISERFDLVDSLQPHRDLKLWVFNGAHAFAAYNAYLDGYDVEAPLGAYLAGESDILELIEQFQGEMIEVLAMLHPSELSVEAMIASAQTYRNRITADREQKVSDVAKRVISGAGSDDFINDWGKKFVEPARLLTELRSFSGSTPTLITALHNRVTERVTEARGWELPTLDVWPVPRPTFADALDSGNDS